MLSNVETIRQRFAELYLQKNYVTNDTGSLSGSETIEIVGASFIADEAAIFGEPNYKYIQNEIDWYCSMSLNVNDIPDGPPKIWKAVSSEDGKINSNYGHLVFSAENYSQCAAAISKLVKSKGTRQASMIYTRPTIHSEWNANGMSDFICTNVVQYLIRDNKLDVVVQMRSNDAWAGYRNDLAWQLYVQKFVLDNYNATAGDDVQLGDVHWQVASLHVYARQFYLLDHFVKTGEKHITKKDYDQLYSASST